MNLSERIYEVLAIDPGAEAVEFEGRWHSWVSLIRTSSAAVSVGDARSPRSVPVPLADAGSWLAESRAQIAFGRNAKHAKPRGQAARRV